MALKLERPADQRDLVLFVPDEILVADHVSDWAVRHRYDFVTPGGDTRDMPRAPREDAYAPARPGSEPPANDHTPDRRRGRNAPARARARSAAGRRARSGRALAWPRPARGFRHGRDIELVLAKGVPLFGVCLGLQAVAEYFGGELGQLDEPVHGKPSEVTAKGSALFQGLPERFRVGRYHSLYAARVSLPDDLLKVTAETDDGVIMALEHRERPIAAVQFHPESILSLDDSIGMRLIDNMMTALTGNRGPAA